MIGLDLMGSTASSLQDIFSIAHPVGTAVLKAYGAGGAADTLADWEQQGIDRTMSPAEKAKKQQDAKAAVAKAKAADDKKKAEDAAVKVKAAASPWRKALIVLGVVAVAGVGAAVAFGGKKS